MGLGAVDNNKPLLAVIIERLLGGGGLGAAKAAVASDAPAVPSPVASSEPKPSIQQPAGLAKPQPEKVDTPSKTPKGSEKQGLELSKPVPEGQTAADKKKEKEEFDYANWKPRDRSALEGPSKEKDLFGGSNPAPAPAKDKQDSAGSRTQTNPIGGVGMKQPEPLKKESQTDLPKKSSSSLIDDKPKGQELSDRDAKRGKLEPSLHQGHGRNLHEDDLDEPEIGGYPDGTEEHLADIIDGQEEEDDPNVTCWLTQGMQIGTSDDMYISESYGYNFSVTSEAMKQFDYIEDVEPVEEEEDDY